MPNHLDLLIFNWQDRKHPFAGGAETNLHEVFGRLAARGHRVTVVSSGWPGAPALELLDGMQVHRCGSRWTYPLAAREWYRAQSAWRPDVVVEDLNKVPIATPLWVREPLILLVHHLFGASAFAAANPAVAAATVFLEAALLPLYSKIPVVAVSESSAKEARQRSRHRGPLRVIHNGVACAEPAPTSANWGDARAGAPVFLYIGRLQRYKRVDLAIAALARLTEDHESARLIIAGHGPDEGRLAAYARELDVSHRVEFRGYVSEAEKSELFSRASANVMTSVKEGWGMSVLDAAAVGTPSIASDSPGLCDVIEHDVTGLLVPHGDIGALADAMRRIARLDESRRLGLAARRRAERFTWTRAADAFEGLFRDMSNR